MMTRRRSLPTLVLALTALGALGACSDDEESRLPGERIPIRQSGPETPAEAEILPVPAAQARSEWTQRGGGAQRDGGHVQAPASLSLAWSADAGAAPGDRLATSGPVIAEGRVYVRDGEAGVHAFDAASGDERWEIDLTPEGEYSETGYGGGLAYADGRLFATTGFGELVALDPATGEEAWRRRFDAPFRAAPAAGDGLVIAVTRADTAYAVNAETGETAWDVQSGLARSGNLGFASPATARGATALPFGSGELMLVRAETGQPAWTVTLVSRGAEEGMAVFPDVTSDPALVQGPQGPLVVAGNAGGAVAAWDARNGARVWQRDFGALSPVWHAGQTVYVATSEPAVQRLALGDGRTLWRTPLQAFEDPEDREGRIRYAGGVLAGGRVLVASSDGRLLSFDPQTGEPLGEAEMPAGASTGPAAAGGTVYVLTDEGDLLAYR